MDPVHREVLRDEIAIADEVMLLAGDGAEIVLDDAEDEPQTLAALRSRGVIDHVFGDEIVEDGVVVGLLPPEQFRDDILCTSFAHARSIARHARRYVIPVSLRLSASLYS